MEGLTCICSNILFGFNKYGKQKQYDRDKPKDNNSLSVPTNPNRVEAYVEALILAGIANEIMLPDLHTVVTYSNDGYAQSGIRYYIIHSISLNESLFLKDHLSEFFDCCINILYHLDDDLSIHTF